MVKKGEYGMINREEALALINAYQKNWNKKLFRLGGEMRTFAEKLDVFSNHKDESDSLIGAVRSAYKAWGDAKEKSSCNRPSLLKRILKIEENSDGSKLPSDFMKKNYRGVVEAFVPKEYEEDYYRIIDKLTSFPYTRGMNRRTVRSREYEPWVPKFLELLNAYKVQNFCEETVYSVLSGNLSEKTKKLKTSPYWSYWYSYENLLEFMIAARIDAGDEKIISLLREMILSDTNTVRVSVSAIRGIIMSDNEELHQLLADFLLAARLQEGIRQAICENADCGTIHAFLTILHTVYENNLIRFSAVKRAAAVWTGLGDTENADRISDKLMKVIYDSMQDFPARAMEYVKSNDSILIMCGLWALGFYDVEKAIAVMDEYVRSGTRNQLLTMGYYNTMLQYHEYANQTALKVFLANAEDYELIAVFMPSFLSTASYYVYEGMQKKRKQGCEENPLEDLYASREEAYACHEAMRRIYQNIPKKKLEFFPVVFPWYGAYLSKTQLIIRMCVTAYALQDAALIDEACAYLPSIDTTENYSSRSMYLQLLTHGTPTPTTRRTLLEAVADKESGTRSTAYVMVMSLELTPEEYVFLEGFLKYKNGDIRENVLTILSGQSIAGRLESAQRLLRSDKTELRMGGLTMMQALKQSKKIPPASPEEAAYEALLAEIQSFTDITDSEQIILEELCGNGKAEDILNESGYGLYEPERKCPMPEREQHLEVFREYFKVSRKTLDDMFTKLAEFYTAHGMLEYKPVYGENKLLANGLSATTYDSGVPFADRYPFKELWVEFYEKHIHDVKLLMQMYLACYDLVRTEIRRRDVYNRCMEDLLGSTLGSYTVSLGDKFGRETAGSIQTVVHILVSLYPDPELKSVSKELLNYIVYHVDDSMLWYPTVLNEYQRRFSTPKWNGERSLLESERMSLLRNAFRWETDEEFKEWFALFYDVDRRFQFYVHSKTATGYYSAADSKNRLGILDYVKAHTLGMIPENEVYKAAFVYDDLKNTLSTFSLLLVDNLSDYQKRQLAHAEDSAVKEKALEFYRRMLDKMLDVELTRGELPTVFSADLHGVKRFYGTDRMVQILIALGKEKLDRSTYYYGGSEDSKKAVLSHLLSVCYPKPEDTADDLARLLKGKKLPKSRLYEVVMYAPQWMDMIQEYLGEDLKCGCYYFMAHMNESFDDKKKAIIAKYTPLTEEELNNGAFDVQWFESAYHILGAETFGRLYDAAKYISDSNKHSRARKYADAALGKVTCEALEAAIQDKRNKDLLMSYGIVPIADEEDVLHRYEFIEAFRKESRQFGAQRKASEGLACDMALKNLATNAGYQDVTRLVLAMEGKMVQGNLCALDEHTVGEVTLRLSVEEDGAAKIICTKGGKKLKSVPAALKKDEYLLYLKETQKKWKEQYRRTIKMLEQAMEEQEVYRYAEISALAKNPVIAPIVKSLVYVECAQEHPAMGLIADGGLEDHRGELLPLAEDAEIRVAHPYDLYHMGCWAEYQSALFAKMSEGVIRKQPFKQVFRELYVKLPEERDAYNSRMFAGNQIQPKKTVGCLKNRRWVADYEEGLQKVYYKDNLIARIYALADWFSPGDIEAPTLEWVEFSDRKTFRPVKISEVPDIIYSEVMRDVDLAISVAHVGGVDPETSHSTIEMREAIIRHNLPLFQLNNVTFEGTHAIVKGKLGSYSIHLGSGVIHIIGGHQVNVLPVHCQSRGKLFLPFVDEDPKTAEIMSKIVLFAKDETIKDPYILKQLD